jgi:hypothetical protein
MTRFDIARDTLKEIFLMCPECKGEGGEKEIILDDGSGPWYECGFCNGKGYMNIFQKIYWKIILTYDNRRNKK